MRCTWRGAEA
ncbi:hypothetical protein YPPY102_4718, partial [Yersinia pestis PY-102]